jgi:hypothetical protein
LQDVRFGIFVNSKRFVSGHKFAQPDESAHDEDIHLHGALTVEHGREHGHAQLGEGMGRPTCSLAAGIEADVRFATPQLFD